MAADQFFARWARILELGTQGHQELEEWLGPIGLGPMVRLGLLARRPERCCEFQRYQQHLPTEAGESYLRYLPEEHLIVVRQEQRGSLLTLLARDPMPEASYCGSFQPLPRMAQALHPEFREPFILPREDAPLAWTQQRRAVLDTYVRHGFMDFLAFRSEHRVNEQALIACGFCRIRDPQARHQVPIVPVGEGCRYLQLEEDWDLLLIKPGSALQLLELMDPAQARYWINATAATGADVPSRIHRDAAGGR